MQQTHTEWTGRPVTIHQLGISALIRREFKEGIWEIVYDYKVVLWTESQIVGLLALEQAWNREDRRTA